jgi:hypothetical protein
MLNKIEFCMADSLDGTGFNEAPIGLREIKEEVFARSQFFVSLPTHTEYRQVIRESQVLALHMFWFQDKTGIAISRDYYAGKIKYFAFGCEHNFIRLFDKECEERNIKLYNNCVSVYKCCNCNYISINDSSD